MRRMAALLAVEMGAVGALVAARGPVVADSLGGARPDDVVAVALWGFALATAVWLLVTTVAYCIAEVIVEVLPSTPRGAHHAVAIVTPRAIRVLVARSVAVTMVGSLATAPAALASEDPASGVRTGREPAPATSTSTTAPGTATLEDAPDPATHEPAPEAPPPRAEHRVRPGDHLWSIAATHLRERHGREPTDAEIARHWVDVIEENRARLRSGDPDLVFPGEVVTLPPI